MSTLEEQRNKPNGVIFGGLFPNLQDVFDWSISDKHRPNEEPWLRPSRSLTTCDIEKFAYKLCARNKTKGLAKIECFKELQDIEECKLATTRRARADKLMEASRKVGDRVPGMRSNIDWIY
ncbi:uncharacterized protein LOC143459282 [Clavelina lepadiformis]|uniref:NADH dehydrogenase [ubiquinone] iron-sulfur protein 5 n=1 Tax=Clavelina lepadiformis TaxID=159417 RepID=A0ABP0F926_CLALP